jgi:hypothetical protein
MGELALADALDFCLLLAEADAERWPRASARWLGRFIIESPAITLNEVNARGCGDARPRRSG